MADHFFLSRLSPVPVIAILRGLNDETTLALATSCWTAGIRLVEVPVQGDEGFHALEVAAAEAERREELVGAGTVYTVADAERALSCGASFLVAPGLDNDTVRFAADRGVPYLPGVTTPTEVQGAKQLGLRTVKLFPAGAMGPAWVSALRGPFPEMNFVAVGGVSARNARDFLEHGAVGVGVGGALNDPAVVRDLAQLRATRHDDPKTEESS